MSIRKAMDIRTFSEFKKNFKRGTEMESKIISALSLFYPGSWGEANNSDEFLKQNKSYDYDFYTPDEQWQIEIKYSNTNRFKDDIIAIRRGIWYMRNLSSPKVLVATLSRYALLDVKEIIKIKPTEFEPWGNKKVYQVSEDSVEWNPWVAPLCKY